MIAVGEGMKAVFGAMWAIAGWAVPHVPLTLWFIVTAFAVVWIALEVWMTARDVNLVYLALRWILRPVSWWYCRTRRIGLERIPRTGPVLVAPNHPSLMDGLILLVYSPRRLYFLASENLWKRRWIGWLCTQIGCVPVHKTCGNSDALHTAERMLARGKALCIFPEGQISKEVTDLKPGVAVLAATTGTPIVPVGLRGTYEAMPPGRPLRRHPVSIAVGKTIRVGRVNLSRVPAEVIERLNEELSQAIRNLAGQGRSRPWVVVTEPYSVCAAAY